jgi:phosphatidylinositol phospholipase C beta
MYYSVVKMFAQNREDRKRVEKALDISGLPSGKVKKNCFTVAI